MHVCLKPYSDLIALATGNLSRIELIGSQIELAPTKKSENLHVLLTGANGFVGLHIVKQLTANAKVAKVYAYVRGEDDIAALKRLLVASRRYGLTITNQQKLEVIAGIFSPDEKSERVNTLSENVDAVIHAAGSTSHMKPYLFYRKESVLPLVKLLAFTQIGKKKSLHIIGSLGADIYARLRDFFKINFFHCGYSRMKWVTRRMTQVAYEKGFSAYIYLPSYVIGSESTGYRDPGMRYAFWQMLRLCNDIGMIWDSGDDVIGVVTGEDLSIRIVDNVLQGNDDPCIYPSSYVVTRVLADKFNWQHVTWQTFFKTLSQRHRLFNQRSLQSLQDRMAAKVLFPKSLPEIINTTSRSMNVGSLNIDKMSNTANTIYECAQNNYLFNRK